MSQADLDLIARALAAGQRAIWTLKSMAKDGASYAEAQRMLLETYEGMQALERLGGPPPKPSTASSSDVVYQLANEAISSGKSLLQFHMDGTAEGARIHQALIEAGHIRPLRPHGAPFVLPTPTPLPRPAAPAKPAAAPKNPAPDLPAGGW